MSDSKIWRRFSNRRETIVAASSRSVKDARRKRPRRLRRWLKTKTGRIASGSQSKNMAISGSLIFNKVFVLTTEPLYGLWAIHRLEKLFNDRNHNVSHWLNGEPCEFYHPTTKQTVKVEIGEDIEALYCFLRYCQKLNNHERIDSDSFDYLLYTITRSKNTKDWEEC